MWRPGRAVAAALVVAMLPAVALADRKPRGKKPPAEEPLAPAPPPALTSEQARAQQLFADGRKYLQAKEFALACTAFEQSQVADPAVGTQLNLGLCFEEWGKTASAYRAYLEAERLATSRNDDRAAGARERVEAITARVPHLELVIPGTIDAATVFLVDERPVARGDAADLLVDPGEHVIEMRIPGRDPTRTTVVLAEGERKQVALEAPVAIVAAAGTPPTRRRAGRFYGGIAASVVGVGAVATASILGLGARADYADAIGDCPGGACTTRAAFDATQDARSTASTMTFVAAGGLAVLGVGVFLILTSNERAESTPGVALAPLVAPDLVGLTLGGTL